MMDSADSLALRFRLVIARYQALFAAEMVDALSSKTTAFLRATAT